MDTPKKRYRKQASQKQLLAMQLKAQGLSKTEALRKAGYSVSTQRNPSKVFTSQAIVTAVDKFKLELADKGLTTEYMSAKFKEWMERGTVQEQQQAYKLFKEVVLDQDLKVKPEEGQIKRRITLEEFIGSPNTTGNEDTQAQQDAKQAIEGHEAIPEVYTVTEERMSEKEEEEVII